MSKNHISSCMMLDASRSTVWGIRWYLAISNGIESTRIGSQTHGLWYPYALGL
ncbi:hypothetical protein K443DRAFT_681220 [Laccaria amethystina LaAM-08-1]|uniref:Uncharacterized protein n=1 Tax=Laccaria amethystina LaAM-08-1 TaxID=1095629 RepID=A0A0C9WM61_9AGAR|nr:hypothetical protein K443DRAFT_681220 [Laccaria amethystina LaAM-08-1]